METWINDVLIDADELGIPSIYCKDDGKAPIDQYGIGR
jgi:hypothetical protein